MPLHLHAVQTVQTSLLAPKRIGFVHCGHLLGGGKPQDEGTGVLCDLGHVGILGADRQAVLDVPNVLWLHSADAPAGHS